MEGGREGRRRGGRMEGLEGRRRLLTGLAGAGQSSPRAAPPLSWSLPRRPFGGARVGPRRPKAPRSPIPLWETKQTSQNAK